MVLELLSHFYGQFSPLPPTQVIYVCNLIEPSYKEKLTEICRDQMRCPLKIYTGGILSSGFQKSFKGLLEKHDLHDDVQIGSSANSGNNNNNFPQRKRRFPSSVVLRQANTLKNRRSISKKRFREYLGGAEGGGGATGTRGRARKLRELGIEEEEEEEGKGEEEGEGEGKGNVDDDQIRDER